MSLNTTIRKSDRQKQTPRSIDFKMLLDVSTTQAGHNQKENEAKQSLFNFEFRKKVNKFNRTGGSVARSRSVVVARDKSEEEEPEKRADNIKSRHRVLKISNNKSKMSNRSRGSDAPSRSPAVVPREEEEPEPEERADDNKSRKRILKNSINNKSKKSNKTKGVGATSRSPVVVPRKEEEPEERTNEEESDYTTFHIAEDAVGYQALKNNQGLFVSFTSEELKTCAAIILQQNFQYSKAFDGVEFGAFDNSCPTISSKCGIFKLDPKTVKPFEFSQDRMKIIIWIIKGKLTIRSTASHTSNGVKYLYGESVSPGDAVVIPPNCAYSFENWTDEDCLLGFTSMTHSETSSQDQ